MQTRPETGTPAVTNPAEALNWFDTTPGERMAVRIHSKDVGGAFTIIEAHVPPLSGPPLHYHEEREEIFEVLDGKFRFHCAGDEFDVAPGSSVALPRRSVHSWVNLGARPARLLFTFVPGGLDDFFPQIAETPPDGWLALGRRHDTHIVGGPLSV